MRRSSSGSSSGPAATVFGYTVMNDVSSRDEQLDGDQWLLGKSMPGFCPVGPVVVTADELDPAALRLECRIDGEPIQDGTTATCASRSRRCSRSSAGTWSSGRAT